VAVTTPQEVAFTIAAKVISMFREMKVPALGIVENMAHFACPHCEEKTPIFGKGGGAEISRRMGVPLIGSLPLDPLLCQEADLGEMGKLVNSDSPLGEQIRKIARDVAARISMSNFSCGAFAQVVRA
jgi:ATP-binding protein involved in chromosome partitioning